MLASDCSELHTGPYSYNSRNAKRNMLTRGICQSAGHADPTQHQDPSGMHFLLLIMQHAMTTQAGVRTGVLFPCGGASVGASWLLLLKAEIGVSARLQGNSRSTYAADTWDTFPGSSLVGARRRYSAATCISAAQSLHDSVIPCGMSDCTRPALALGQQPFDYAGMFDLHSGHSSPGNLHLEHVLS